MITFVWAKYRQYLILAAGWLICQTAKFNSLQIFWLYSIHNLSLGYALRLQFSTTNQRQLNLIIASFPTESQKSAERIETEVVFMEFV